MVLYIPGFKVGTEINAWQQPFYIRCLPQVPITKMKILNKNSKKAKNHLLDSPKLLQLGVVKDGDWNRVFSFFFFIKYDT